MSRLTEKLAIARGVVVRLTAKIELRADAIIAEEQVIEAMTDDAFSGHEAMLAEQRKGLDVLKRELAFVSNDPLGNSSDDSTPLPAPPSVLNGPAAAGDLNQPKTNPEPSLARGGPPPNDVQVIRS